MSISKVTHTGGCLCGDVRYEVVGEPSVVAICHCRMCQRMSGSAFIFTAKFEADAVVWSKAPTQFQSSEIATRSFCPKCGSSLGFHYGTICWFFLGSMDYPEQFTPQYHSWADEELPWAHLNDGLPRHSNSGTAID